MMRLKETPMGDARRVGWEEFSGLNIGYLAELFDLYRKDPASVEPAARALFDRLGPPWVGPGAMPADAAKLCGARALATAIRMYGHHAARLDPLGSPPPGDSALMAETHGLSEAHLAELPAMVVGGPVAAGAASAQEAIGRLRQAYQGTMGLEFEHVSSSEERDWWIDAVESGRYSPPAAPIDGRRLLERLTQVEAFERFLQSAFPAQTRFSLEGLDMLVPMLDEAIVMAAAAGARSVVMGMAHRGRLNVLAHILGKPYERILAEFGGDYEPPSAYTSDASSAGWTGDVRYHLGARRKVRGSGDREMSVLLVPNPSHLEFIDPVVEGMARAASERREGAGPAAVDESAVLAVLIHGEAAFVGEGIVAETLNLSRLPGYRSGGTLHIIENNQIGFTTPPELARSTLFASDLAKGFEIPVIHVNADDPEACIVAVRLSHAYLEGFHKDVVIDLIGYRRLGHNEGDEPSFTQPVLYRRIETHPTVRRIWAVQMVRRGVVEQQEPDALERAAEERLQAIRGSLPRAGGTEAEGLGKAGTGGAGAAAVPDTAVPLDRLRDLNEDILALPPGFHLHRRLEPLYARRRAALSPEGEPAQRRIDWAHAEALAFASLLAEGVPIRLTGQDTSRGTFSQRHLILHDFENGAHFCPLQRARVARASFDVWDSPLSENATLGFEFGYSVQAPGVLVLWEAQYGDFANAAQVIIDSFVTTARSKWGLTSSLVLLLPHGYEGQGPDHSSARLERFLQMAAEGNLRVAISTTAAQYFHLLRRQAKLMAVDPRPLVLLSPKSLLRHPLASSSPEELSRGTFLPVMDDAEAREGREMVRRLILCSGKIFTELVAGRGDAKESGAPPSAIVRLEELYPFPEEELRGVLQGYPGLQEVVWAQEEPENMGAWAFVAPRLRDLLGTKLPLRYAGRPERASPAEGSHQWHAREQRRIVREALGIVAAAES